MGRLVKSLMVAAALVCGAGAMAQPVLGGLGRPSRVYDGRFTFARLRWDTGRNSAWNHDFPRAEQNLTTLLRELSLIDADTTGSLILDLDDPQLFPTRSCTCGSPGSGP